MAQRYFDESFSLDTEVMDDGQVVDWVSSMGSSEDPISSPLRRKGKLDINLEGPSWQKQLRCLRSAIHLIQNHATITNCMGIEVAL